MPTKTYQSEIRAVSNDPDEETPLTAEAREAGSLSTLSWFSNLNRSTRLSAIFCAWCGLLAMADVSPMGMNVLRRLGRNSQIRVCVEEIILATPQPSIGATVKCYDKDVGGDDNMGSSKTGSDGCTTIWYDGRAWWDYMPGGGWKPDIMCVANKNGFVRNAPAPKNDHDPKKTSSFFMLLHRDRLAQQDYGQVNGCGPYFTGGIVNNLVGWVTGFKNQCDNHDKCYWDCKVFDAFNGDPVQAQKFCDQEMLEAMETDCNVDQSDAYVDYGVCMKAAATIYHSMLQFFATHLDIYDRDEVCPNNPNDPSYGNIYSQ